MFLFFIVLLIQAFLINYVIIVFDDVSLVLTFRIVFNKNVRLLVVLRSAFDHSTCLLSFYLIHFIFIFVFIQKEIVKQKNVYIYTASIYTRSM